MKIKSILASILFASSFGAYADLPRAGARCDVNVVKPDLAIDAGFEVNTDCSVVFVKPPKVGDLIITGRSFTMGALRCDGYLRGLEQLSISEQRLINMNEQYLTTQDETEKALIRDNLEFYSNYILQLEERNAELGKIIGLRVKFLFETKWDELIDEYTKLNPNKSVTRLPLIGSMLTIDSFNERRNLIDNGVSSINIPGITLSSLSQEKLNEMGVLESEATFIFGESLVGSMDLNLKGMCGLRAGIDASESERTTLRELQQFAEENGSETNIVANATMVYPLMLERKVSVIINQSELSRVFEQIISRTGTFSQSRIADDIMDGVRKQVIKITVTDEHTNKEDVSANADYLKGEIVQQIIDRVLTEFTEMIPETSEIVALAPPAEPYALHTVTKRTCRSSSSWFGLSRSRHCHDSHVQIRVPVDGVGVASQRVSRNIVSQFEQEFVFRKAIYLYTTLAFTKEENI